VAAYSRSVMNNNVSNTVIIELSKRNESSRNWLDLPLLVSVCFTDVITVTSKHIGAVLM